MAAKQTCNSLSSAGWRVWVVSVCPLSPELIVLALHQNLGVVPVGPGSVRRVHGNSNRVLLSRVWSVVVSRVIYLPSAFVFDDEISRSRHWHPLRLLHAMVERRLVVSRLLNGIAGSLEMLPEAARDIARLEELAATVEG